jgi:acetate kinase
VAMGNGSLEKHGDHYRLSFREASNDTDVEQRWPQFEESISDETLGKLIQWIEQHTGERLFAAGHRIVHGGTRTHVAALIDSSVMDEMEALIPIAPLHQPACLAPVRFLAREHPHLPQVACFDTAFHHSLGRLETLYGLPRGLSEEASVAMAFTACLTNTSPASCPLMTGGRRQVGLSSPTSATARACVRCAPAAAARPAWVSLRWTAS